jgi:hypothetical protein
VAFDRSGNAYFSFITSGDGIGVRKSTNGGASWGKTVTVGAGSFFNLQDKPEITVGPDHNNTSTDRIYVGWDSNGAGDVLKISSSTDGKRWTTPVSVDGQQNEIFAEPAVSANGTLYVAWIDFSTANIARIKVASSTNDGASFSTPVVAATSSVNPFNPTTYDIPAQPTRGISACPSLAVDRTGGPHNGRIYLTYTDTGSGGHNNTIIKLTYSDNGGATWSTPVTVNNDTTTNSHFFSWVTVDPVNGDVDLAWYDARNDTNNKKVDVYFARGTYTNGVLTFTNVKATDVQSDESNTSTDNPNQYGDYMGVAAYNGKAFPVWCDTRLGVGNEEIFTVAPGGLTPTTSSANLTSGSTEALPPAETVVPYAAPPRGSTFDLAGLSPATSPSSMQNLLVAIPAGLSTPMGTTDWILDPASVDQILSTGLFSTTRQKNHGSSGSSVRGA